MGADLNTASADRGCLRQRRRYVRDRFIAATSPCRGRSERPQRVEASTYRRLSRCSWNFEVTAVPPSRPFLELFVIDGSKALRKAIRRMFGNDVPVQRCPQHKQRNVLDHLPERDREPVKARLRRAWTETNHRSALDQLITLAVERSSLTTPTRARPPRSERGWKRHSPSERKRVPAGGRSTCGCEVQC
jgi:Transposase, Mutator family